MSQQSFRRATKVMCVLRLDEEKKSTILACEESCEEEKVGSKLRYRSSIHCIYPVRTGYEASRE